jgi:hypothetical protein
MPYDMDNDANRAIPPLDIPLVDLHPPELQEWNFALPDPESFGSDSESASDDWTARDFYV